MNFVPDESRESGGDYSRKLIGILNETDKRVDSIMNSDIVYCSSDTPISEAAMLMHKKSISCLIIKEGGRAVGIWTEADAVSLDFTRPELFSTPIREVMIAPFHSITGDTPIHQVALKMRINGIRHYVVVGQDGEPRGVVTQTDVVMAPTVDQVLQMRRVSSILHKSPLFVESTATLGFASVLMKRKGSDSIIVIYGEHDYGIITERDIVRFISLKLENLRVGDVATKPLLTVNENASLFHARKILIDHHIRHLGVVNLNQDLIGILSFTDILNSMESIYVNELKKILKEREETLNIIEKQKRLFEQIIEFTSDAIAITDQNGVIEMVNPAFTEITGYGFEEVAGKNMSLLKSGLHQTDFYENLWRTLKDEGRYRGEIRNKRKNGEIYPQQILINRFRDFDDEKGYYISIFRDMSSIRESENKIYKLQHFDRVTELPNRNLLTDDLDFLISGAGQARFPIIFLDIQKFHRINESIGPGAGDDLLLHVSRQIRSFIRDMDLFGRYSSDEFVIIAPEADTEHRVLEFLDRLVGHLKRPVEFQGESIPLSWSVGVSIYPYDGDTAETLIKNAEIASKANREEGLYRYHFYSGSIEERYRNRFQMERDLLNALNSNQFEVHYQPIFNSEDGSIVLAEALLRWNRNGTYIPPDEFIPVAEECDLIVQIGDFVLHRVMDDYQRLARNGHGSLKISINISIRQMKEGGFMDGVEAALMDHGVPSDAFIFELTESMLFEFEKWGMDIIQRIRSMGIEIALDDFGKGYSSLSYLKHFPVDHIKIDRSFLTDMSVNANSRSLVEAIIRLSHTLGKKVVAEGVETEEQQRILTDQGCDLLQGYYLKRPGPFDNIFNIK
jgi:diguanylate cyclase (GGDEF)-like protein/PAS domain S-box-containing protein